MGYKALITIDLPGADGATRDKFYEFLSEKKWYKIDNLTTAWKTSFKEGVSRERAIEILILELKKATNISKAEKVSYALQLEKADLVLGSLSE